MKNSDFSFEVQISEKSLRLFYVSIAIVDVVLLAAYLLLRTQLFGPLDAVMAQLDFRHENVAAVWYSSIVLFLTSMVALLCFHVDSRGESSTRFRNLLRYGWLVIALTFAGFSFDEMGSIHERSDLIVSGASYTLGLPGWVGVLWPFMLLVFLYYVLFFCSYLSCSRISQVLALMGGGLLISVPVQEFLEARVRSAGQQRRTLVGMLEEGSEVVGTTLILIAFLEFAIMSNRLRSRRGFVSPDGDSLIQIRLSNQSVKLTYVIVVLSALASLVMAWFLVPHLKDLHHRGNPSVWHPSLALFVAGVLAFVNLSLECKRNRGLDAYSRKWTWVLVGAVCLWFSVDFESGINAALMSWVSKLPTVGNEMILSVIVSFLSAIVFFSVYGARSNRLSRVLFFCAVFSWAGIFVIGSLEARAALKIISPTLFLLSFVESMKSYYLAGHCRDSSGIELQENKLATFSGK